MLDGATGIHVAGTHPYIGAVTSKPGVYAWDDGKLGITEPLAHTHTIASQEDFLTGLRGLFDGKLTDSYFFAREGAIEIMEEIGAFAENAAGEIHVALGLEGVWDEGIPVADRLPEPLDNISGDFPAWIPITGPGSFVPGNIGGSYYYYKGTNIPTTAASRILNGTAELLSASPLRPGTPRQPKYDTFHQLQNVVNILPIQTHSIGIARHDDFTAIAWWDLLQFPEYNQKWMITDVILTSNIPQTVTVEGAIKYIKQDDIPGGVRGCRIYRDHAISKYVTPKQTWNQRFWALEDDADAEQTLRFSEYYDNDINPFDTGIEPEAIAGGFNNWIYFWTTPPAALFSPGLGAVGLAPIKGLTIPIGITEYPINETLVFPPGGGIARLRIVSQEVQAGWHFMGETILSHDITVTAGDVIIVHDAVHAARPPDWFDAGG
jgi:hypothetical protein